MLLFYDCSLLVLDLHWEIEQLMLLIRIIGLYWNVLIVLSCYFVLGDRSADLFVFDLLIGQLHVRYKYNRQDIIQDRRCTCNVKYRRVRATIVAMEKQYVL